MYRGRSTFSRRAELNWGGICFLRATFLAADDLELVQLRISLYLL